MDPPRDVLLFSGYYGCGNAGDEAVLAGIRDAFRRRAGTDVTLTALSQNPDDTRALHGIDAAYRMDIHALRTTIGGSDLLISGGGSLLQDTTSLRSLLYYLFVIRIATSRKVPFMFYAQGIGPLRRGISRKLVRMTADHAAYITVRDEGSAALLREIGVTKPKIEVTADPAFGLNPASDDEIAKVMRNESIPTDAGAIGVALRPWGDSSSSQSVIERYRLLLVELEAQTGLRVVMLPMHHPDDLEFALKVSDRSGHAVLRRVYPPEVVLGVVSRMSAVVAMRLHALIFAARVSVPPLALSYDPKVRQLMHSLDLDCDVYDWLEFDPSEIAAHVAATLSNRDTSVAGLCIRSQERDTAAMRNCDVALELLGLGRS